MLKEAFWASCCFLSRQTPPYLFPSEASPLVSLYALISTFKSVHYFKNFFQKEKNFCLWQMSKNELFK